MVVVIVLLGFGVLLVSAYVCYCHYTISIGKRPMSHYDFCKSIALAWLDPKLYWKNQMVKRAAESNKRSADNNINVNVRQQGQGGDSSSNAEGGCTQTTRASSNKKQKRAPPVSDDSLCPRTGALRHRLEVHHGEHLPTLQSTKGAKCALHNWAGEK